MRRTTLGAIQEVEQALPFALRGVDCDNGSEFINWNLRAWCQGKNVQLTRGRPYKKDDNAHVEQKNWTHVRKLLGWDRYDSVAVVEAINDLYRHELRWLLNLYLPSVRMVKKTRVGSKLRRVYDVPQTPLERVARSGYAEASRLAELTKRKSRLDPFELARTIDRKLKRIYELANHRLSPGSCPPHKDRRNGCGRTTGVEKTLYTKVTFLNGLTRRQPGIHRSELPVPTGGARFDTPENAEGRNRLSRDRSLLHLCIPCLLLVSNHSVDGSSTPLERLAARGRNAHFEWTGHCGA